MGLPGQSWSRRSNRKQQDENRWRHLSDYNGRGVRWTQTRRPSPSAIVGEPRQTRSQIWAKRLDSAVVDGNSAMPIDPELLEILACPNCKTKVDLVKDGHALKCGQCKRVYPIKDDIPVMLIDEATIEP